MQHNMTTPAQNADVGGGIVGVVPINVVTMRTLTRTANETRCIIQPLCHPNFKDVARPEQVCEKDLDCRLRRCLWLEMLRNGRHDSFRVVLTLCTYTNQRNLAAFKERIFERVVFLGSVLGVRRVIQLDSSNNDERLSIAKEEIHMLGVNPVEGRLVFPRVLVHVKDVSEADLGEEAVVGRGNARLQASEEFGLCRGQDTFFQTISRTIEGVCLVPYQVPGGERAGHHQSQEQ